MKHYSALVILALIAAMQAFTSCTAFTYTYAYPGYDGYAQEEVVADTSRWWLKPVYIRTDTTTNLATGNLDEIIDGCLKGI